MEQGTELRLLAPLEPAAGVDGAMQLPAEATAGMRAVAALRRTRLGLPVDAAEQVGTRRATKEMACSVSRQGCSSLSSRSRVWSR